MATMTKEQLEVLVKDVILKEMGTVSDSQMDKFQQLMEGKFNELSQTVEKKLIPQPMGNGNTGGFKSLSEFAYSVYKSGARNASPDPRLLKAAGTPASGENDPEYLGFLIPEEYRNQLFALTVEQSDVLSRAMIIPMATNVVKIPVVNGFDRSGGLVHGGVQFYWIDEESGYTATRPRVARVELHLKKVAGLAYMSDEIMEDSPISIEPFISNSFSDGLNWTLDDVFITGTGVGKPLGILNAPCKITVAKETGQAASTIVTENIIKMYARIWNNKNSIWMANRACIPQLFTMSLAVGTGGVPVYLPANSLAGKPYDTLFGLPLMFSEHCSALGTAGDIILVDWSQYLVGKKAGVGDGIKAATSIHLKFDYDQVAKSIGPICSNIDSKSCELMGNPLWN